MDRIPVEWAQDLLLRTQLASYTTHFKGIFILLRAAAYT